jgi:phosphopantetheine--protein transferase-like protein
MIIRKHKTASVQEISGYFNEKGLSGFFTKTELEKYFNGRTFNRLAARLLAKEIIIEQLKLHNDYLEISILNDTYGKPHIEFTGETTTAISSRGLKDIHLSLSHSKKSVTAFVVFEYLYNGNITGKSDVSDHSLGN